MAESRGAGRVELGNLPLPLRETLFDLAAAHALGSLRSMSLRTRRTACPWSAALPRGDDAGLDRRRRLGATIDRRRFDDPASSTSRFSHSALSLLSCSQLLAGKHGIPLALGRN